MPSWPTSPADGPDDAALEAAAERIATALSKAGYVATTRVGGRFTVRKSASTIARYPMSPRTPRIVRTAQQAEVLGTHVQRLATIVNGDCACTTHVRRAPSPRPPATEGASDDTHPRGQKKFSPRPSS